MFLEDGKIISHESLGNGQYLMEISCPQVSADAVPGQFVHISCGAESANPLLRRPISIHRINKEKNTIELYYLVVGKGTTLLSAKIVGSTISLMGPLGRGFELNVPEKRTVLVGGGIGIAPLLALAEELKANGKEVVSLLGAAGAEGLVRAKEFAAYGDIVEITEDGSLGEKGLVTEYLQPLIDKNNTIIYTCGPEGMLKAVVKAASEVDVPCQISLEAAMACGVGACLGCTCVKGVHGGYPKVCKDGPVFWSSEVKL
ncbi:MAG: hypothetical protein APF76_11410 [Desulfitibacter sp. BRH_c19]|nr:MAG: hypothetical protein APF76_11410 [Desulfitibacter sp. BRH_c19]